MTEKILVVEDKKSHRRFICDTLRLENYQVIEASTGEEALEILKREEVDLVILDHDMPGMTGLECYMKMQGMPTAIPVVFITVYGFMPEFIELRRKGVHVLDKPLDHRDISKAVRLALQGR